MKEKVIEVELRMVNKEKADTFLGGSDVFLKHGVEFIVDDAEPWTEVMRRLQSCVEAYYGYEFTGYGSRAEDGE